jgi:hypothetical protein
MAKQKDQGDLLEIFFDKERDSIAKFQKIIRNAISAEKKNIFIDMTAAPALPRDYLASLALGAKSLRSYGYKVSIMLTPANYAVLKPTDDAAFFNMEIAETVEDETPSPQAQPEEKPRPVLPCFTIEGNIIHVSDEEMEQIPAYLGMAVNAIQSQGYRQVVVDLTHVYLLVPAVIHTLLLETLNSGNSLCIRIQESMREVLQSDPQSVILNVQTVSETVATPAPTTVQPAAKEVETDKKEAALQAQPFSLDFHEDVKPVLPAKTPAKIPEKEVKTPVPEVTEKQESGSPWQIEVNCLRMGNMSYDTFIQGFPENFEKLFPCGEQLYIDLSEYENLDEEVIKRVIIAHWEAMAQNKRLGIRILKEQKEQVASFLPVLEEIEKHRDTTPKFLIVGSRMELYNVDNTLFMEKFSEHFKKLLATGHKQLVVDIAHLKDLGDQAVNLLMLSYLEAVGRGLSVTLRIRPELEESFQRSGRGRALPLEIVRPEVSGKTAYREQAKKGGVDMKKLQEASEKDRLSDKILKKQFETVHIESRGSVSNWEPAPVKGGEREVAYDGPERRKDKRYKTPSLAVCFAKGSLGKIAGRHYPLHNLCQAGACFTSAVSLSRGEPMRVKIFSENDSGVELPAKAVWCLPVPAQALFRVGVQFINLSEVAKIQLRELIGKLYAVQEKTQKL